MNKNNIKPWLVLVVCCGLAASSIGISINSSGVFYTPVSEDLGIMRGTFSMHMTIFSIVTAMSALIVPKIMNKFSYKLILILSVLISVISTGMMAYSRNIYIFYLLGAIRGFSTGLFSIVPLTMIVNGWFEKNHGLATSIVFGFSGLAGAICSPILARCIEVLGWETAYIVKAGIILALCLPAVIYPFEVTAKDEGKLPFGYSTNEIINKNINKNQRFDFMTTIFISFCIFALINTTITGITQHLPGFAQSIGYSASVGASLLSAGSDKIGPVKASITMIVINTLGVILLMSGLSSMIIVGAFLFGSIYSVGAVGLPVLTKYFFGIDNYSKVFPIISFLSNLGAAFALTLVGYIYDFTNSYNFSFILAIGINTICLILTFVITKENKIINREKLVS